MRLLNFYLRGAIGIFKGMGLHEVEIDFSIFRNGLIALVGDNGRGKTTIIENLHPYRTLISRDGNIVDHFFLKDSFRILEFSYEEQIYRSEIYIDAETKRIESYLKKGNRFLNDGKASTYDILVNKLFGSQDLFFNSIFSAQQSQGLADLSSGDRRDLFYELLGLDKYQKYQDKISHQLKTSDMKHIELKNKSLALLKGIEEINNLIPEKKHLEDCTINLKTEHKKYEEELQYYSKQKEECFSIKIELLESKKHLNSIHHKVAEYNKMKNQLAKEYEIIVKCLKEEKDIALGKLKSNNTWLKDLIIQKSIIEKEISEIKGEENNKKIIQEIKDDKEKIEYLSLQALEIQRSISGKSIVSNRLEYLASLKEKISELNNNEKEYLMRKQVLDNSYNKELSRIAPLIESVETKKKELAGHLKERDLEEAEMKTITVFHEQEIDSLSKAVENISLVPCSVKLKKTCNIFEKTYQEREKLEALIITHDEFIKHKQIKLSQLNERISYLEYEIQNQTMEISNYQSGISLNYSADAGRLESKRDKNLIEYNSLNYEYNPTEMEKLRKQLEQMNIAEINYNQHKNTITNLIVLIESKQEMLSDVRKKASLRTKELEERLANIEKKIKAHKDKIDSDLRELSNQYEEKITKASSEYNTRIVEYDKMIKKETTLIDPELDSKLDHIEKDLRMKNELYSKCLLARDQNIVFIAGKEARIKMIESEIRKLKSIENNLADNNIEIDNAEKDIREYSILARAFDKTGIPVLKLENSGREITGLANDLLSAFENESRIVFETTKLTRDKKRLKEVFNINVIDNEGFCELKNRSGGEKVWIESSIQLALGILLRQQGKKLETSFLDEQDGALDRENALIYRTMIEKAHKQSGVHNTIIITHRPELMNIIGQKIILTDNGIKIEVL